MYTARGENDTGPATIMLNLPHSHPPTLTEPGPGTQRALFPDGEPGVYRSRSGIWTARPESTRRTRARAGGCVEDSGIKTSLHCREAKSVNGLGSTLRVPAKLAVVQRGLGSHGSVAQRQERRRHFGERGFESRQIHQEPVRGRRTPMRGGRYGIPPEPPWTTEILAAHSRRGAARQSILKPSPYGKQRGDSWPARSDVEGLGRPPRGPALRTTWSPPKWDDQGRWSSLYFGLHGIGAFGTHRRPLVGATSGGAGAMRAERTCFSLDPASWTVRKGPAPRSTVSLDLWVVRAMSRRSSGRYRRGRRDEG